MLGLGQWVEQCNLAMLGFQVLSKYIYIYIAMLGFQKLSKNIYIYI